MLGFGGRKGRIRAAFNQLSLFDVAPTRKTRRRTIMTECTALAAAIEKHWRTHCPKMVRELTKANQLKSWVLQVQEFGGSPFMSAAP